MLKNFNQDTLNFKIQILLNTISSFTCTFISFNISVVSEKKIEKTFTLLFTLFECMSKEK